MNGMAEDLYSVEISNMKKKYDTSNPMIAEIIRAKEERLKMLRDMSKKQEEEGWAELNTKLAMKKAKKKRSSSRKKSEIKSSPVATRRSLRIQNSITTKEGDKNKEEKQESQDEAGIKTHTERQNVYGAIPGVEVGHHWLSRLQCSLSGIHRPTMAGIHGGPDGAYSVALSGGYPEDVDEGYSFIYTGAGGRDLKGTSAKPKNLRVAPQTRDQQLEGVNLSLVRSIETKKPVRVIRGYKCPPPYAPENGYRYDGLYQVVEYWEDVGKTGHRIYRFKMERMEDQAPPPWVKGSKKSGGKKKLNSDSSLENSSDDDIECITNSLPINYKDLDEKAISQEVDNLDREIDMCIKFFIKVHENQPPLTLDNSSEEEGFVGFD